MKGSGFVKRHLHFDRRVSVFLDIFIEALVGIVWQLEGEFNCPRERDQQGVDEDGEESQATVEPHADLLCVHALPRFARSLFERIFDRVLLGPAHCTERSTRQNSCLAKCHS